MRVIWEADDIKVGRRTRKPGSNECWMIGYVYRSAPGAEQTKAYCKISLNDGMVTEFENQQTLAQNLNLCEEQPVQLVGEVDER